MTQQQPQWSLKGEIQKRKTQELINQIATKQIQTGELSSAGKLPPGKPRETPAAKPLPETTHTMRPVAQPARQSVKRPIQLPVMQPRPPQTRFRESAVPRGEHILPARTLNAPVSNSATSPIPLARLLETATGLPLANWTKRQKRTALLAISGSIAICLFSVLLIVTPSGAPNRQPLPTAYIPSVVTYLKGVGLPALGMQTFAVNNASWWTAGELVQFRIQSNGTQGTFLALSYESPAAAGRDAFRATLNQKFKNWHLVQINNILLLASPTTAPSLINEVSSHLTQYLVAPYRSYIPTATPGGVKLRN